MGKSKNENTQLNAGIREAIREYGPQWRSQAVVSGQTVTIGNIHFIGETDVENAIKTLAVARARTERTAPPKRNRTREGRRQSGMRMKQHPTRR